MSQNKHYHYWLASTQLLTKESAESTQVSSLFMNAIAKTPEKTVSTQVLGNIQKNVQMQYRNVVQEAESVVLDVVIMSISYLGYMTDDEFAPTPQPDAVGTAA